MKSKHKPIASFFPKKREGWSKCQSRVFTYIDYIISTQSFILSINAVFTTLWQLVNCYIKLR